MCNGSVNAPLSGAAGLCLGFQSVTLLLQPSLFQRAQQPFFLTPAPDTKDLGAFHCSNHSAHLILSFWLLVNVTMIFFRGVLEHVRCQSARQVTGDATLVLDIKGPLGIKRVWLPLRHNGPSSLSRHSVAGCLSETTAEATRPGRAVVCNRGAQWQCSNDPRLSTGKSRWHRDSLQCS